MYSYFSMTIEVSLRKPFPFPRMLWARNNESRQDYHWIGHTHDEEQKPDTPGERNQKPQNGKNKQRNRRLTDITLGDVEDAIELFKHQLLPTQENWIRKNSFCQIPLKRKRGQPPTIFGRVKTCYPSDGVLDNIEEMELYFPNRDGKPDTVHIDKDEISRGSQRSLQSYFVRVRALVSAEEKAELAESVSSLSMDGFYPEFEGGFFDVLEMNDANRPLYPWMYVVGSRWFASIPESIHMEVRDSLKSMTQNGQHIFNYHPNWLPKEIYPLNDELGFQFGFTSQLLVEPRNVEQVSDIVSRTFNSLFLKN